MTQSASKILDAIRKLILETDDRAYEKQPSSVQQISFVSAKSIFSQAEIDFNDAWMETVGMIDADFGYTNLAFLLSDQCGPVITTAVFKDVGQQSIIGRRAFNGSLLSQISEAREFLDSLNQTEETFEKHERVNRRDYPEEAIEEAILNAVLHREYATGSGILIKVFSDRLEFISPGGLAGGL
ncbi:MAG: AAA family ATPase, partial [Clostridiales bacterium]|nr:AAA family ATPase [Clostridiales bacterium]